MSVPEISNFEALLNKAVTVEITNMQAAATKQDTYARSTRRTYSRKPKIEIVKDSAQEPAEISPEKMKQIRDLARKFDQQK